MKTDETPIPSFFGAAFRRVSLALLAGGLVFALAGTKGILKMPDTFSRMQASRRMINRFIVSPFRPPA